MCSKQEVSPVKWEFNSGDRVELLDGFDRGVIVRQEEKKLDAYGDPFDCLYVVKLDDGPAVALLQSRVRGEQEVSKVELQGETCPWCDRSDMVSSWGWASSGEFENFYCGRCERGFKVLPDIEDDEEDEPDHDAPDVTDARAYVETSRFIVDDRPRNPLRYAVVPIRGAGEIYEHSARAAFAYLSDARKFADELNDRVVPELGE